LADLAGLKQQIAALSAASGESRSAVAGAGPRPGTRGPQGPHHGGSALRR
jgi:hypothetical protein